MKNHVFLGKHALPELCHLPSLCEDTTSMTAVYPNCIPQQTAALQPALGPEQIHYHACSTVWSLFPKVLDMQWNVKAALAGGQRHSSFWASINTSVGSRCPGCLVLLSLRQAAGTKRWFDSVRETATEKRRDKCSYFACHWGRLWVWRLRFCTHTRTQASTHAHTYTPIIRTHIKS